MQTIEFLVQGSAAEPYALTFTRNGNTITAFCSCPAGDGGTACKHRLSILAGLKGGVVSGNVEFVEEVASWLPGSNIEMRMADLDRQNKTPKTLRRLYPLQRSVLLQH